MNGFSAFSHATLAGSAVGFGRLAGGGLQGADESRQKQTAAVINGTGSWLGYMGVSKNRVFFTPNHPF